MSQEARSQDPADTCRWTGAAEGNRHDDRFRAPWGPARRGGGAVTEQTHDEVREPPPRQEDRPPSAPTAPAGVVGARGVGGTRP
jgi:hypothetical protein